MNRPDDEVECRILVIDDNQAIHEDFRKIFCVDHGREAALADAETALFGVATTMAASTAFRIDSAFQGQEGLAMVRHAQGEGLPYSLAFVDVRMPPGWDGIETTSRIWEVDPAIQVVICTAYSDYSWSDMLEKLGHTDRLVILKKPFDTIEVLQLSSALTEKWRLARQARRAMGELESRIAERTHDLERANLALQAESREHQRAAAALRKSEGVLAEAHAIAHLGSWEWDVETNRVTWSPELYELFGVEPGQFAGTFQDGMERVHPDDRAAVQAIVERAARRREPFEFEMRIVHGSGAIRMLYCRGIVQEGVQGAPVRLAGVCQDVTERKAAEHALSRSNRSLKMLSSCNESLIRVDVEQELLDRICRIAVEIGGYRMAWVGYARDDSQRMIEAVAHAGADDGFLARASFSWQAQGIEGCRPEGRAVRDSEVVVVENLGDEPSCRALLPLTAEHGYKGALCLPLLDNARTFGVLTLYAAEVAPVGSDEIKLLQELADNLAFGISSIHARTERQQTQDAVLLIAQGVSAGTGAEFFDLLVYRLVEVLHAEGGMIGRLTDAGGHTAETVSLVMGGLKADGITYGVPGTPTERVLAEYLCLFERDVQGLFPQDRALATAGVEGYAGIALRSSQGRPLGVLAVYFRGRIEQPELVRSTLRIFAGRAAAELERQEADARIREQASLLDKAHDAIVVRGIDDRIRYWNKGAERLYGWSSAEALGRTMEELLCEDPAALHEPLTGVMENGEWSGNIGRQRHRDGRRLTVTANWTLVRADNGRPQSILAITGDATERLALEERLQQSQRLEAVGQLTGGVAHDFNNLLTVILGNSELMVEELGDRPRLLKLADMIRSSAQRGADLTHRLLAFARRQTLEPKAVDANRLIAGMDGLLRRTLSEDIRIEFVQGPGLWRALVDPAQLEGAVLNLCINARDAMPGGGRLTIETANAALDDSYVTRQPGLQRGHYVLVAVSDTGSGIPPENLKRVFEPFFTTKEFGKGTGLGLSMVYGFVKQSSGQVMIYSEVGHGTSVKMYLPRADWPEEAIAEASPSLAAYRGTETILLTEDDELVRVFAVSQLAELGYRVIAARNGPEALEILRNNPAIDLLFTDVVMPGGMSGPELADAALRLRPALKLLYTSGYTEKAVVNGERNRGVQLLNKPYRRIDLAQKVRAALSAETLS